MANLLPQKFLGSAHFALWAFGFFSSSSSLWADGKKISICWAEQELLLHKSIISSLDSFVVVDQTVFGLGLLGFGTRDRTSAHFCGGFWTAVRHLPSLFSSEPCRLDPVYRKVKSSFGDFNALLFKKELFWFIFCHLFRVWRLHDEWEFIFFFQSCSENRISYSSFFLSLPLGAPIGGEKDGFLELDFFERGTRSFAHYANRLWTHSSVAQKNRKRENILVGRT